MKPDDQGFQSAGLRVASAIRLHRMMTVSSNIIQRELGELSTLDQLAIDKKIKTLFQLN